MKKALIAAGILLGEQAPLHACRLVRERIVVVGKTHARASDRPVRARASVAKLDDEVVVVDEQPRYHLAGCRSIRGRETIPLPAKEAVEYEFTPCEVCTPVRVLSARNRAASKS